MITLDQYLEALKLVSDYHLQLQIERCNLLPADVFDLRFSTTGDYITCLKTKSKYFTVGEKYEIIKVGNLGENNWYGEIRNNVGKLQIVSNYHPKMWSTTM